MSHDEREARVVILKRSAPRAIEWTAERIVDGGVVALPTDTVYGIAGSLAHREALRRIYEIKGRTASASFPVLVSSSKAVEHLVHDISHDVGLLLDLFWPGPLTVVLPARAGMPDEVTAGTGTVGLRMPNHPLDHRSHRARRRRNRLHQRQPERGVARSYCCRSRGHNRTRPRFDP